MTLHWTTRFHVTTSSICVPSASCSKSFWTSGRSRTRSVAGIEHTTTFHTSLCAHFFRFLLILFLLHESSTVTEQLGSQCVRQLGTILFVSDTKGRAIITTTATRQLSTTLTAGVESRPISDVCYICFLSDQLGLSLGSYSTLKRLCFFVLVCLF